MAAHVWSQVIKEAVIREADVSTGDDGLWLDLGIGQPQMEALFDIKVIDTDAPLIATIHPNQSWSLELKNLWAGPYLSREETLHH